MNQTKNTLSTGLDGSPLGIGAVLTADGQRQLAVGELSDARQHLMEAMRRLEDGGTGHVAVGNLVNELDETMADFSAGVLR
jgi:hypothetical protein